MLNFSIFENSCEELIAKNQYLFNILSKQPMFLVCTELISGEIRVAEGLSRIGSAKYRE